MSPKIIQDLDRKGHNVELTVYTSNSQAITKLFSNKDKFDLAIISKLTMKRLEHYDVFDKEIFRPILSNRKYNKLTTTKDVCLPYLWGPTVFVTNEPGLKKIDINFFFKKKRPKLFFIDDPAEFFSMFQAANFCKNNHSCVEKLYKKFQLVISADNFTSSIAKKNFDEKFLFYGWLGALSEFSKVGSKKKFDVIIPENVVVGQDYLCAMKNMTGNKKTILEFAKELTNRKNSLINEQFSGYYSPYISRGKVKTEKNKILSLKKKFEEMVTLGNYSYLPESNNMSFKSVQKLWFKLRYE